MHASKHTARAFAPPATSSFTITRYCCTSHNDHHRGNARLRRERTAHVIVSAQYAVMLTWTSPSRDLSVSFSDRTQHVMASPELYASRDLSDVVWDVLQRTTGIKPWHSSKKRPPPASLSPIESSASAVAGSPAKAARGLLASSASPARSAASAAAALASPSRARSRGRAASATSTTPAKSPASLALGESAFEAAYADTGGLPPRPQDVTPRTSARKRRRVDATALQKASSAALRVDDMAAGSGPKKSGVDRDKGTASRDIADFEARLEARRKLHAKVPVRASAAPVAGSEAEKAAVQRALGKKPAGYDKADVNTLAWSRDAPELLTRIDQDVGAAAPGLRSRYTSWEFLSGYFRHLAFPKAGVGKLDAGVEDFSSVRELSVSGNALTGIHHVPPHLLGLNAYANHITGSQLRSPAESVGHLGLGYNDVDEAGLQDLVRDFPGCMHLDLSYNALGDLDVTLALLSKLPRLTDLVLLGCPVALLPSYRHRVITELPELASLDDHDIKGAERYGKDPRRTATRPGQAARRSSLARTQVLGRSGSTSPTRLEAVESGPALALAITAGALDGLPTPRHLPADAELDAAREAAEAAAGGGKGKGSPKKTAAKVGGGGGDDEEEDDTAAWPATEIYVRCTPTPDSEATDSSQGRQLAPSIAFDDTMLAIVEPTAANRNAIKFGAMVVEVFEQVLPREPAAVLTEGEAANSGEQPAEPVASTVATPPPPVLIAKGRAPLVQLLKPTRQHSLSTSADVVLYCIELPFATAQAIEKRVAQKEELAAASMAASLEAAGVTVTGADGGGDSGAGEARVAEREAKDRRRAHNKAVRDLRRELLDRHSTLAKLKVSVTLQLDLRRPLVPEAGHDAGAGGENSDDGESTRVPALGKT